MAGLARANRLHLVVGVVERSGGTLYCTAVFLGADGRYLGKHRKVMPTASERLVWGFGDGSTLTVVDTELGRVGAVICWENYMPLLRAAMYAKGVEIYCAPTADARTTWLPSMRHIAQEGRCFVLSANQFARRKDYPLDYPTEFGDDPQTIISRGGSCIIGPLGELLAGPDFSGETILTAEIDLNDIARARHGLRCRRSLRAAGHLSATGGRIGANAGHASTTRAPRSSPRASATSIDAARRAPRPTRRRGSIRLDR